jgi:hypothetical protein
VVEDLPYHAERIYLSGKNSYSKPWQAIANLETDFPEI